MSQPGDDIAIAMARARRRFPGWDVDACYPICWPVYIVRLTLTVLEEHEISTVARYILRLTGLEPRQPAELSRLLGLSQKFVAGAAAELIGGELAVQRPDLNLEITERGQTDSRQWRPVLVAPARVHVDSLSTRLPAGYWTSVRMNCCIRI